MKREIRRGLNWLHRILHTPTVLCHLWQTHSGFLAERGGFEPPSGFKPEHDFQSCALDQLSHLSTHMINGCRFKQISCSSNRHLFIILTLRLKIKCFFKIFSYALIDSETDEKADGLCLLYGIIQSRAAAHSCTSRYFKKLAFSDRKICIVFRNLPINRCNAVRR